jgi:lipoprotein-releasing system ATP-binding protein
MPTLDATPTRLRVRELRKVYETEAGPLAVLDGVDLDLQAGDHIAVEGPSGAGKSTLLHILGGLDRPTQGDVEVDGRRLGELSPRELAEFRNRSVGFVFQDHNLLPQCTVLENVLLPCAASGGAADAQIDRARRLLDAVGLSARVAHRPSELSGGEKQRVAVARALVQGPRLILCDEPTGNLDRANAQRVAELIVRLAQEAAAVLVVVTHSEALARRLPTRLQLLDGRLTPVAGP